MSKLDGFLSSLYEFVRSKDAAKLRLWLRVEPPLPPDFTQLAREMKAFTGDLDAYITRFIPDEEGVWPGFLSFVNEYLEFWRSVNFDDLLETHTQLSVLTNACITALSNASYGLVILPTAIHLSSALATLAMTLDKRPDLTRHLKIANEGESRKTLVEGTAESIQRAFTMCLTERGSNRNGIGRDGKPEGKKIGIYSFANLVLKLLFKCRKTRLANQLFTNISQHSPPLTLYPASQRVTFLYYLGRFYFANGHFYRAQLCLQEAYDQCHAQCINQRRLILIYLIASNIILGRFPSRALMSRPESVGVLERFAPVTRAIRRGDLAAFKQSLGSGSGNEDWLFQRGLLLPLLYRAEVLVWRSLARRVFLLTFHTPIDPRSRKAPTLDLNDLVVAAQYCQEVLQRQVSASMAKTTNASLPISHPGVVYGHHRPDLLEIEAVVAGLVQQDLLHGFVSHSLSRFAILGAKQRGGALLAGFPPPFSVLSTRGASGRNEVPGWVREERKDTMGGIVNLTGIARPVGTVTS